MSRLQAGPGTRAVPAQVDFLTIYNPSLGDTEETERDQIIFWTSKDELLEQHRRSRKPSRKPGQRNGADHDEESGANNNQAAEDVYHQRLRQIGLARGMVDFAKNFSNDKSVSSVETAKSRIVLHELEPGWWILASIDLTRLPSVQASQQARSQAQGSKASDTMQDYEYSTREVAPTQLLLSQLLRAHRIFLLHHATSLGELYEKLRRDRFCAVMQKYWEKMAWDWDVLLHGNPAVEVYSTCIKLAGGGELGVGVGEEEWGSGEREVIESFVARTEGCVDLLVGRYGQAAVSRKDNTLADAKKKGIEDEEISDSAPWLGNGEDPGPADGIVFSGVGALSRRSLATVSQWMEAIFKHGDDAYGVREHPSARPRAQRKPRQSTTARGASNGPRSFTREEGTEGIDTTQLGGEQDAPSRVKLPKTKAPNLRRQAMENSTAPPGIPAPLVSAVERSLDVAVTKAAQRASSKSPRSSPKQELSEEQAMKGQTGVSSGDNSDDGSASSWFDTEKVAKVLTFGYGSSWTLSPKGFNDPDTGTTEPRGKSLQRSPSPSQGSSPEPTTDKRPSVVRTRSKPAEQRLQEIDPTPEVSDDDEVPFVQRLEKSIGRFLIGLSGDLENMEIDIGDHGLEESPSTEARRAQRLFHRTLTVETTKPQHRPSVSSMRRSPSRLSYTSVGSRGSDGGAEPKTSAAASVDGPAQIFSQYEKFYRSIHHQLGPLQGPLLSRTDPDVVAQRIQDVISSRADGNLNSMRSAGKAESSNGHTIYDLIYDPIKLTIRTSIPNVPVPTSFAESNGNVKATMISGSWYTLGIPIGGLSSTSTSSRHMVKENSIQSRAESWTRTDALNVHSQILNSFLSTHFEYQSAVSLSHSDVSTAPILNDQEIERTVKTNRGWWVLWMRVPSSMNPTGMSSSVTALPTITHQSAYTLHRAEKEAFLIRKSNDAPVISKSVASATGRGLGSSTGRWLLREQPKESGSRSGSTKSGDGAMTTAAKGVSEGIGVDARRWIEGLLHLST